jgi:hypothetical protein
VCVRMYIMRFAGISNSPAEGPAALSAAVIYIYSIIILSRYVL